MAALTLSPRALTLCEPIRDALLSIEWAVNAQAEFELAGLRREFRVVVADFLAPIVVPGDLAEIRRATPAVRLHVEPMTDASVRRLLNGDVNLCYWRYDLSLFGLPSAPPGFVSRGIATGA